MQVKPFVKWAGGKGQLLSEIHKYLPQEFGVSLEKYAEPFIGGGAVLFNILSNYKLKEIYISDINKELINTYVVIRDNLSNLIELLICMQNDYLSISTEERKNYFNKKRERYNTLKISLRNSDIEKAALFIFLNKTCFNGLYRVNKKGLFNVPIGSYKNPLICDTSNLSNISESLNDINIVHGDYRCSESFIDERTFVYFDPPYRPLTSTASFTSYSEFAFDDNSQIELAEYISLLDRKGAKILLSNSDPKNANSEDCFFDNLYKKHNIYRVEATRMINSKSTSRGKISELLITNY